MSAAELRAEVETLLAEWAHAIDSGHAESALDFYSADAEQHLPGASSIGSAAIAAGLARRARMTERLTRHLFSNLRIVSANTDSAPYDITAHAVLTLFRSDTADRSTRIVMVADVVDRYVRGEDGRLRIAHRQVLPVFQAAD